MNPRFDNHIYPNPTPLAVVPWSRNCVEEATVVEPTAVEPTVVKPLCQCMARSSCSLVLFGRSTLNLSLSKVLFINPNSNFTQNFFLLLVLHESCRAQGRLPAKGPLSRSPIVANYRSFISSADTLIVIHHKVSSIDNHFKSFVPSLYSRFSFNIFLYFNFLALFI
ncbi:hypothetical protein V8G54_026212 [Vigna mungo]|uniref:Uncharacterized protein n=1 Tax=Vigna mungo TaxID=3915 RepID=A0AAQ3MZ77_VIGMU